MTTEVTQRDVIEQIRKRVGKITPGKWAVMEGGFRKQKYGATVFATDTSLRYIAECKDAYWHEGETPTPNLDNAEFIAHAPTDIKTLLQINEKLTKALEFYESPKTWDYPRGVRGLSQESYCFEYDSPIVKDRGKCANEALSYIPEGI